MSDRILLYPFDLWRVLPHDTMLPNFTSTRPIYELAPYSAVVLQQVLRVS